MYEKQPYTWQRFSSSLQLVLQFVLLLITRIKQKYISYRKCSGTGSASHHRWIFWGWGCCSALPLRSTTGTSRHLRLPVPSCPSKMNTHSWTLRKEWLTFCLLLQAGEAFREGNHQTWYWPQSCAGLLQLSWLTPHWQPALTARRKAQIGCWPICRRDGGNSRHSPQPSRQCLLLASFYNLLDFGLTLTLVLCSARASDG